MTTSMNWPTCECGNQMAATPHGWICWDCYEPALFKGLTQVTPPVQAVLGEYEREPKETPMTIPPRLIAAFRAIAEQTHDAGWRVVPSSIGDRDISTRTYTACFRRLCDDAALDELELRVDPDGDLDLDRVVASFVEFLLARPRDKRAPRSLFIGGF